MVFRLFIILFSSIFFFSCKPDKKQEGAFKLLDPSLSHVNFSNNVTESDSVNILDYLYFYNGAGIAAADFNNDGLEDHYFVSNQESNRL